MDVQLSDGLSFEIFKHVKVNCPVVFTTAYDEYALQAFKVNSIDYLLKPVDKAELMKSLHKFDALRRQYSGDLNQSAMVALLDTLKITSSKYRTRFLIKLGQSMITVFEKDVAYFLSERKLTFLVTHNGKKHMMDEPHDELEGQLNPREFFRLNRQFIASVGSIAAIHKWFNGKLKLQLKPTSEHEVTVSREKAKAFREWLNQ
jgi:two-component system LytT family response regulator